MSAGYFTAGKTNDIATFEWTVRRLPKHRNFVVAAGLQQAVDYLLNLRFETGEIEYLRGLPHFSNASPDFFEYLKSFRFTGDLFAVPEGTPLFAGEPMLTVRAPIIEAQIPETYLLSTITFQTLIATKAARLAEVSAGRDVVEFGTRRAHTPEAGVLGARGAYIGGCAGTSNTLAGYRFGIPVMGTAAHSWVMSFPTEIEAFRRMQELMGSRTVHLIDTYGALEGTRNAIQAGEPFWGVRLDSGDFTQLSKQMREMLDNAGFPGVKIMVSGDLDEWKIRDLIRAGAPVDAFGVGTELATSGDAPSMGAVYKIVEIEGGGEKRFVAKQVFRFADHDLLTRSSECASGAVALQRPVILGGNLIEKLPDVHAAREHARKMLKYLPAEVRGLEPSDAFPVLRSAQLEDLIRSTVA